MFHVAEFRGQEVETASAPEYSLRLRIVEKGIATLDQAVREDPEERAVIVVAFTREADEPGHVLGRFVGCEFKAEDAEICIDHGFEFVGGRLLGERRSGDQRE